MLGATTVRLSSTDLVDEHWPAFPGMITRRVLDPDAKGSKAFRMSMVTLAKGTGTPRHVHERSDEGWYVVSGAGLFHVDGRTVRVKAGDFMYAPRNCVHQVINEGEDPFHYIAVTAPPCDFEGDNRVTEPYDRNSHHVVSEESR